MLVHRRVTPSSKFAGTHLYTWVERGTMRVKYLAQEHNAVPRPGLEPGPPDPESSALTIRPPRLPQTVFSKAVHKLLGIFQNNGYKLLTKSTFFFLQKHLLYHLEKNVLNCKGTISNHFLTQFYSNQSC